MSPETLSYATITTLPSAYLFPLFQIVEEGYTLSDILNDITKEDLRYLRLR